MILATLNPRQFPVTCLFLIGRDWQAEYYVQKLTQSPYSTNWLRKDAERALEAALAYDY